MAELLVEGVDRAAVLSHPNNTILPLNAGIELVIPPADRVQPTDGLPLTALATALRLTPTSLLAANCTRPALLAPGFVFQASSVQWEVPAEGQPGADASLNDVAQTLSDTGAPLDAVAVALSNADKPGMFRPGTTLVVDRRVIEGGWTLADNASGIPADLLAKLNTDTIDLLPAGSAVFLKTTLTPDLDNEPLGALAHTLAIEPGDLLRHNPELAVRDLPVPGLSALPEQLFSLRLPYCIRAGQTLSSIAALCVSAAAPGTEQTAAHALCEANRSMPGTLAPGQVITVAGQPLTTQAGDSFDALMSRAAPSVNLTDLATAIAMDTEALATGALLLCPPGLLASTTTPDGLAADYGLTAGVLLSANAATQKLIVPGLMLKGSQRVDEVTVVTAQADSINAILRRFALAKIDVTVEDLVHANRGIAFLAAGAQLLLPPADTVLSAAFGEGGWQLPEAIFPLRAWVTLKRDPELVAPALRGNDQVPGAAVQDISLVAAIESGISWGQEGTVALGHFAAAIEGTIPGLKVASGQSPEDTDVWGISFADPGGITQVKVSPHTSVPSVDGLQPLTFALRPLSNTFKRASGVELRSINPTTGGWGATTSIDYHDIDLEVWAQTWLAGLDRLCKDRYAVPAELVAPSALARLLAAKKALVRAVSSGLSPILIAHEQSGGAIGSDAWEAAREALHMRLLDALLSGYGTAAILQFNATVDSPATAAKGRLWGAGRLRAPQAGNAREASNKDTDEGNLLQLGRAMTTLGNTCTGTVSFPLDAARPTCHAAVALQPAYAINEVEIDLTPAGTDTGTSKRLSFVQGFDPFPPAAFSAQLGTPVIPVPLRSYPSPPNLSSQQTEWHTNPATLREALHWSYVFTYTHASTAQDQALIEVEFNAPPSVSTHSGGRDSDALFKALAQYANVQETLWQILDRLQAPSVSSQDTALVTALNTYADLAEHVAALWTNRWTCRNMQASAPSPGTAEDQALRQPAEAEGNIRSATAPVTAIKGTPHERYQYLATLNTTACHGNNIDPPLYSSLTLQRIAADGTAAWPEITVIRADGVHIPLNGTEAVGQTRQYLFPSDGDAHQVTAATPLAYRWSISDLHIARYQNANAAVTMVRNAQLLGLSGPQSCPAFIYRTPRLEFPAPAVPQIIIHTPLRIALWSHDVATNPLAALFDILLNNDAVGREIMIGVDYGYRVEPSPSAIDIQVPVMLLAPFEFIEASTVQSIVSAIETWIAGTQPATTGGFLSFSIHLYSSVGTAPRQPVVTLQRIVSQLA